MLTVGAQLRSSRTAALLDGSRHGRQAAGIVCGRGSRATDGQKPGTASGASRARTVLRSERGVGGRGAVAVGAALSICGAVAVRGVPDPALCERNGEALQTREAQAVYSDSGGAER